MSTDAKSKKANFNTPATKSVLKAGTGSNVTSSITSDSRVRRSTYGMVPKSVTSSMGQKTFIPSSLDKSAATTRNDIRIFNERGEDVTPRPLAASEPSSKKGQLIGDGSVGTPTDVMASMQASMYQGQTVMGSTFGGGPFARSVFMGSQSGRSSESMMDDFPDPNDSLSDWTERVEYRREEVKEILTEEDLNAEVCLLLTETDTIWLVDLPTICVNNDSEEAVIVKERNDRYMELSKSRAGNDRFSERGMNTFNDPVKNKSVQTDKISFAEKALIASQWDIADSTTDMQVEVAVGDDDELLGAASEPVEDEAKPESVPETTSAVGSARVQTSAPVNESQATVSSLGGVDSIFGIKDSGVTGPVVTTVIDNSAQILQSESLQRHLLIVERAINLNSYQPKQASYRDFPTLIDLDKPVLVLEPEKPPKSAVSQRPDTSSDLVPSLERLWSYHCPLTKGHNVSCITWNKINPDLVAVGYGQFEYNKQKTGLVCCWSIKNPEYPERVYITEVGVTSIDFSQAHPNLLAAGMHNGTIAIFNVRTASKEPVLDSFKAVGKHTGPVWQLKWIDKEHGAGEDKTEVLVSTSTDGRVTQWQIRKGFEHYDLMKKKKVPTATLR